MVMLYLENLFLDSCPIERFSASHWMKLISDFTTSIFGNITPNILFNTKFNFNIKNDPIESICKFFLF